MPPRIAPFHFNEDLSEGVRAQVTCMVDMGDAPFVISWSKDGQLIQSSENSFGGGSIGRYGSQPQHHHQQQQTPAGLTVNNMYGHSSTIMIERVAANHTGNYTCHARNSVAEVSHTAELVVRGNFSDEGISRESIIFATLYTIF